VSGPIFLGSQHLWTSGHLFQRQSTLDVRSLPFGRCQGAVSRNFNYNLPCRHFNPLMGKGNYSATSNNIKLVHWPLMGGLLHLVQRWGYWVGPQPAPRPLLDVPNVTVHPSTASVPITILLYNGPLLCSFNVSIKGLNHCITPWYFPIRFGNYFLYVSHQCVKCVH